MAKFKEPDWSAGSGKDSTEECGVVIGTLHILRPRKQFAHEPMRSLPPVEDVAIHCTKPKHHGEQSIADPDWRHPSVTAEIPPGADEHEYRSNGLVIKRA